MSSNILTQEQKDNIIKAISIHGSTATELSNTTKYDKKIINNLLFTLEGKQVYKRFIVGSNKPLWYLLPKREINGEINIKPNINNNINNNANNNINNDTNNNKLNTNNNINNTNTKIKKNVKFNTEIKENKIQLPHFIIDLGNVHDCLQKLELYDGNIIAICNEAYLGYGVGEKCKNKNIEVIKFSSLDKNTVMSEIFFRVSHLFTSLNINDIIIVSQSSFFSYLPEIATRHNKSLVVVKDWENLKGIIQ